MSKVDIAADITKPGEALLELVKERAKEGSYKTAGVRIGRLTFYGKEMKDKRMFPKHPGFKLVRRAAKARTSSENLKKFRECMSSYINERKRRERSTIERLKRQVESALATGRGEEAKELKWRIVEMIRNRFADAAHACGKGGWQREITIGRGRGGRRYREREMEAEEEKEWRPPRVGGRLTPEEIEELYMASPMKDTELEEEEESFENKLESPIKGISEDILSKIEEVERI